MLVIFFFPEKKRKLTGVLEADTAILAKILKTFNFLWLSILPNSDRNIVFFVVSLLHAQM